MVKPRTTVAQAVSTTIDVTPSEPHVARRVSSRLRARKIEPAATSNMHQCAEVAPDASEPSPPPPKRRKRTKRVDEPVVYDIAPVERKVTSWRGRLGFACLNTILRSQKPDAIFCSRTCRIDTILKNGPDFPKELGRQNALDLLHLVKWNEQNNIRFMRISSEMFPFASHKQYGYTLDYAAAELKAVGDLANSLGHRLTTHPGQFTQLGSPKEDVITASIRELEYHVSMFELMGIGRDGVMIIHMGGVYGDKQATLERFKANYARLPKGIKDRLVLENDEICYNVDDLLPVCEELNIPIVLDYHHDWIYPSSDPPERLLQRINAIWHAKGIHPKQHLSSPRPNARTVMQRRAHAGRCAALPAALDVEGAGWWYAPDGSKCFVDLMVEAKDKEQAVFELYRMYGLADVVWENLRPAKLDLGFEDVEDSEKMRPRKKRSRRLVEEGEDPDADVKASTDTPDGEPAVVVDTGTDAVRTKTK